MRLVYLLNMLSSINKDIIITVERTITKLNTIKYIHTEREREREREGEREHIKVKLQIQF